MDCEQIKEILDAYSLGAATNEEASALEEHMADCVRCWSALNEAQRTAAALALSTAIQQAPQSLRRRILAEAELTDRPAGPPLVERLRGLWPFGVGALAAAAVASLAFALFLQLEVSDLRDESDELATEIESADAVLTQQQQLMAVLAAPDAQKISLEPTDPSAPAAIAYHWSGTAQVGALFCDSLPALQEGQVYLLWLIAGDGRGHRLGSCDSLDGGGQIIVDLRGVPEHPVAIGVSIEDSPDAQEPGEMLLFATLR